MQNLKSISLILLQIKIINLQSSKNKSQPAPLHSSAFIEYVPCHTHRKWAIPDLECHEVKHSHTFAEYGVWLMKGHAWTGAEATRTSQDFAHLLLGCLWSYLCYVSCAWRVVNSVLYQLDMVGRSRLGKGNYIKIADQLFSVDPHVLCNPTPKKQECGA